MPTILLIIILFILIVIILLYLIIRIYKYFSFCQENKFSSQLPEYINKKLFITRDMYQLQSYGTINENSTTIILAVHDLYGRAENFSELINSNLDSSVSVISYQQRNIFPNKSVSVSKIGILFDDLTDVCLSLHYQFPNKKIVLLLEGFNSGFINLVNKRELPVSKIIISNLISNFSSLKFTFTKSFKKIINFFYSINNKVTTKVEYNKLVKNNFNYQEKLKEHQINYYFNELWQFHRLNNNIIGKINKNKIPVLIIQANNDVFYNNKQYKGIKKNKNTIIFFENNDSHFLFCNKVSLPLLKAINDFIS